MAGYEIRPLAELGRQARGFFTQSVPGAIASVWANTFTVFAKVLALLNFEHEQRRAWLFRQLFASTADRIWLLRHGFELGLTLDPAAYALGTVTLAATPGTVVPAGLQFTRADDATYTVVAGATATGNSVTLAVQADTAGLAGNLDAGATLSLVDPDDAPAGLGTVATVDVGLAGGLDEEGLEPFRARVLARKRQPPQGGSAPDYETWTREALGSVVDRVFVASFVNDTRSVWVAFTVFDQPNGIPSEAQVAIVQNYVNDSVRRPVTARVYAIRLTPLPIPVEIQDLAPDTTDVRDSVRDEVVAEFIDRARPGLPDGTTVFSRSWISEAVSRAVGEDGHTLTLPAGNVRVPAGYLPVPAPIPVLFTDPAEA